MNPYFKFLKENWDAISTFLNDLYAWFKGIVEKVESKEAE